MSTAQNDVVVEISRRCNDVEADLDRLKKLAQYICRRFCVEKATISIAIVTDEEIKKVNEEFLNTPEPTDVISFDLSDDPADGQNHELVVNAEEAARQAKKRDHSTEAELALYITHGLLHNLGFDDADENQSKKMHNAEDEILQQTGFGVVYGG